MRLLSAIAAVALLATACDTPHPLEPVAPDEAQVYLHGRHGAGHLEVLTRNLYIGTPVDPILTETDPALVPVRVAEAWATIQATDAVGRLRAMAREIARTRPHVVGLQEVSLLRTQTPSDFVLGMLTPNAASVALDFQSLLVSALEAFGASYVVAATIQNSDVELPMVTDPSGTSFTDVRLTDFDVLLVRADVDFADPAAANFGATLPLTPVIEVKRGWTAADVTVDGITYHVLNTHLEAEVPQIRNLQAAELIGLLQAETGPTVIIGDFNSGPGSDVDAYHALLADGFEDAWVVQPGRRGPGYTCCQAGDLSNRVSQLDQRIDLVLFRNLTGFGPRDRHLVFVRLLGDNRSDRKRLGLWPSDHAGVVATFVLPRVFAD